MSIYKIVGGRIFQGREIRNAEKWVNDAAASGWDFVSALPIVEDGHAMYVFHHSGTTQLIETELPEVPEVSYDDE